MPEKGKATVDRRVQRTRRLLRDSLMALILEKGYDAVTVQDITEHANLARATFYLHYRDKEDLLLTSLEEIFDELKSRVEVNLDAGLPESTPPAGLIAFQHAEENSDLYRVILSGQGATPVALRIRDYLAANIQESLEAVALNRTASDIPLAIIAHYIAGSLLMLISWWLENNMPYSAEYMAHTFRQLNTLGVAQALNVAVPPAPIG